MAGFPCWTLQSASAHQQWMPRCHAMSRSSSDQLQGRSVTVPCAGHVQTRSGHLFKSTSSKFGLKNQPNHPQPIAPNLQPSHRPQNGRLMGCTHTSTLLCLARSWMLGHHHTVILSLKRTEYNDIPSGLKGKKYVQQTVQLAPE